MINTIMLREHNRVCGVLKKEHPEWDDEQLFQTAKMVILGRCDCVLDTANLYQTHTVPFVCTTLCKC